MHVLSAQHWLREPTAKCIWKDFENYRVLYERYNSLSFWFYFSALQPQFSLSFMFKLIIFPYLLLLCSVSPLPAALLCHLSPVTFSLPKLTHCGNIHHLLFPKPSTAISFIHYNLLNSLISPCFFHNPPFLPLLGPIIINLLSSFWSWRPARSYT